VDIFGCESPGVYVKMGMSVIERRNRFRKVKNFSAMYPVIQLSRKQCANVIQLSLHHKG